MLTIDSDFTLVSCLLCLLVKHTAKWVQPSRSMSLKYNDDNPDEVEVENRASKIGKL